MSAEHRDAMEMRARTQQYTGPSAGRIASLIPHAVGIERGWFRTTTAICHEGGEPDGLAFRQRADGNGIDVRCHSGSCTRGQVVTAIEGLIGLPIWTAYEPVAETPPDAARGRWPVGRLSALVGLAALLAAPLALGHGLEMAATNVAALGVAGVLLTGLPGRARRAFRS